MIILTLILLLIAPAVSAQQLAFPTAEGFGRLADGGRGGIVCHVNSRAGTSTGNQISGSSHHEGTYRYCINLAVPRTIVFDVGGTINHSPVVRQFVNNPYMTIAGQTVPGETLIRGMHMVIMTNNIVIRYLIHRTGDVGGLVSDVGSWRTINAGTTGSSTTIRDIILDHTSLSWSNDSNVTISGGATDMTYQWSIIAEGLHTEENGEKPKMGETTGTPKFSFLHNLIIGFQARLPYNQGGTHQHINNVVYNNDGYCMINTRNPIYLEFLRNHMINGPTANEDFSGGVQLLSNASWQAAESVSLIYFQDNYHDRLRPDETFSESSFVFQQSGVNLVKHGSKPTGFPTMPVIASMTDHGTAKNDVLAKAGARIPVLSADDARLINYVQTGTGRIGVNTPVYPSLSNTGPRASNYDSDHDGMPDTWETACSSAVNAASTNHTGLSNSDEDDGALIVSSTGYSALEHYLNEVAGDYATGSCGGLDAGGDTTAPTNVAIASPSNAATVSGTSVNVCATADDETAMDRVEFFVDTTTLIGTDTTETSDEFCVTWNTTTAADGNRVLSAIAYDTSENPTASSTITANVDNAAAYTAIHTGSAPTINGNLSEFASANLIEFDVVSGNQTDCKMMYDSTNLYIGCTTTDTYLTEATTSNDNSSIFNDDSLEIAIDPNNSNGAWTSSDYKLVINVMNDTYDAHTQSNTAWAYGGSTSVTRVGDIDGVADDTSWTVEAAIPWSSIGVTPSTSDTYAINLQINDEDASSTTRYRWNGTSANNLSDAMDVVLGEPAGGGDTTDPTVSITAPLGGASIGGTYTLRADAQDESGIQDVQFYRDTSTAICSADTVAPFECAFDTTGISEGSHTFHAVARDNVSPTPNDATSATVTVTVDNTTTSAPSSLTVTPSYNDVGYLVSLNWDDVTDAVSYQVERCNGASCSDFEVLNTEVLSDYKDESVARKTEYCYRIRAFDVASNPSSYSSTVCDLTLDAILLDEPSALSTTHSSTVTVLGVPNTLSTTHSGTVTVLGGPNTLSTTHSTSPAFLGNPSGLATP